MDHTSEKEKDIEVKLKESESPGPLSTESEEVKVEQNSSLEIEIGDGFEILELIGKGGMGTVYKVRDTNSDQIMAVKILKKELADDTAALKRFEQEAEAASKLSHTNLISVYRHGKTKTGEPYLVMDYLEGASLASILEKEGQLGHERVIDIFIQVCNALEHAHENGVIHRDIKPTNIILSKDDTGAEVAKIVDFGIAKVMNASTRETHNLTQTGEVFGSPHYMSPEQCLGFMLEEPADIYSLGCSLYETLTGSPPFGGSNPIQLVVKHINDEVDGFDKELKKDKRGKQLESVTLKCLKKEPEERFQSVVALRADLEAIKSGNNIPKYNIKPKAKPVFTRTHLMAGVAIFMGTFFYSVTGSELLGVGSSNKIANALISIVFIFCFGSLIHLGIEKFKAIKNNKKSAKNWWLMLLCLSSGLAGIVVVPAILETPFFNYKAPLLYKQIASIGQILHVLFSLSFVASTIGFFLFKKAKEVSGTYIFIRKFIITLLLVILPVVLVPTKLSKVTDFCATALSYTFPEASNFFHNLSAKLRE